ncbi:hypothetical protein AAMO2058_001582900 [Amorphochlora amoebiformis]
MADSNHGLPSPEGKGRIECKNKSFPPFSHGRITRFSPKGYRTRVDSTHIHRRTDMGAFCAACCFCCLGEGDRADLVIESFRPVRVKDAFIGQLIRLVGYVTPASTPLRGNVSGREGIFLEEQKIEHWTEERTEEGKVVRRPRSRVLHHRKSGIDFWLCDGKSRIFVQGSLSNTIFATRNVQNESPPHNPPFGQSVYTHCEQIIYVGEKVSALGIIREDPETGFKRLLPLENYHIPEEHMDKYNWNTSQKKSWNALTKSSSVLLVSNKNIPVTLPVVTTPLGYGYAPAIQKVTVKESKELKIGSFSVIPEENLTILDELGSGNFGVAYKAKYKNKIVVVKVPKVASDSDFEELANFARLTQHKNILSLIGVSNVKGKMSFVTAFASMGSLDKLHKKTDMRSESNFLRIACDASKGLAHLHSLDIVQRDIACRNLLMNSDGTVMIADWGLSRRIKSGGAYAARESAFAWPWAAPESLKTGQFSLKSDVWMLGVTFWELLTGGREPYDWPNAIQSLMKKAIIKGEVKLTFEANSSVDTEFPVGITVSALIKALGYSCLEFNPLKRPTATKLVKAIVSRDVKELSASDEKDMKNTVVAYSQSENPERLPYYESGDKSAISPFHVEQGDENVNLLPASS